MHTYTYCCLIFIWHTAGAAAITKTPVPPSPSVKAVRLTDPGCCWYG